MTRVTLYLHANMTRAIQLVQEVQDACERKKKRNEEGNFFFFLQEKNSLQFELRVLFHEPFQRFRLKC